MNLFLVCSGHRICRFDASLRPISNNVTRKVNFQNLCKTIYSVGIDWIPWHCQLLSVLALWAAIVAIPGRCTVTFNLLLFVISFCCFFISVAPVPDIVLLFPAFLLSACTCLLAQSWCVCFKFYYCTLNTNFVKSWFTRRRAYFQSLTHSSDISAVFATSCRRLQCLLNTSSEDNFK